MQELHPARIDAPRLSELLTFYLEKKTLKPKTIALYRRALQWGISDWMDIPIDRISKRMIADRHQELSNRNGPRGTGKDCANLTMRTLKSLMNFAIKRYETDDGVRLIKENPVVWVEFNRSRRRKDIVQDHQLPAWFREVLRCDDPDCRDYLLVLLFMGFRRSEGRLLRWADLDFQAELITARDTKNGTDHILPMPQYINDLLSRRYWYMKPEPKDYVFPGRHGRGALSDNYKGYQRLWEPMGFAFRPHALRRTFLTAGARLNLPPLTLKWLANHETDNDVTLGYVVRDPESLREPIEKISQRLLELGKVSNL